MGDHDHSYKVLFAHPQMVRDLLEAFVGGDWLGRLDFSTLQRVSDSYISDDLRARADDIVWRVRCGEHPVYLLIEFQSSIERYMAVRVQAYVGLLYQDLLRAGRVAADESLPAVLPIVLYNGLPRWSATQDIASLIQHVPEELERYRAQIRYLLIDEGSYADGDLAHRRNFVALLFRLENCRRPDEIAGMVSTLMQWLVSAKQDSPRRAFSVWLDRVILARLKGERVRGTGDLWEKQTMLSERFDQWRPSFCRKEKPRCFSASYAALW
jgi:hypothetical protein